MKGIRLFIRRATLEDQPGITAFREREGRVAQPGQNELIGFLLGDLVASIAFDFDGGILTIRDFWVAQNLRRKRIARAMLAELDGEAHRHGTTRIAVRPSSEFVEAFRRLGFTPEPDGTLVRTVERVS